MPASIPCTAAEAPCTVVMHGMFIDTAADMATGFTLNRPVRHPALWQALFSALADPSPAADAELPRTGVTPERERQLSSAFIHIAGEQGGSYGTRCSTVVVLEAERGRSTVHVFERTRDEAGNDAGLQRHRFELPLQP